MSSPLTGAPQGDWMTKPANPFRYFNSSPQVIRLVVMMYVKHHPSLRNVEERKADVRSGVANVRIPARRQRQRLARVRRGGRSSHPGPPRQLGRCFVDLRGWRAPRVRSHGAPSR